MVITTAGCAYRFSNENAIRPAGARTIAIEAVYDTSNDVLPHQILWEELQRSVGLRSKMVLTTPEEADTLLRAQIVGSGYSPQYITRSEVTKDPKGDDLFEADPRSQLKNLTRAGAWTTHQQVKINVLVDLWDLRKGRKIFEKTYAMSSQFLALRAENSTNITAQYLAYDEAFHRQFREMSRSVANSVAADLIY